MYVARTMDEVWRMVNCSSQEDYELRRQRAWGNYEKAKTRQRLRLEDEEPLPPKNEGR